MGVGYETRGRIAILTLNRPEMRNAVDRQTARLLYEAALRFHQDDNLDVAILTGAGGNFCAGADLKAIAGGDRNVVEAEGDLAPMGPSRLRLSKPVIAAIEGYAVAGGLELALWCDLRVVSETAVFGVFCRRFGVPLIDLGTIRLPRLIGQSRASDMILTGRAVEADEAHAIGLANRLVPAGQALEQAIALAEEIAAFPQRCLRADRRSMLDQWQLSDDEAVRRELLGGLDIIEAGETAEGAGRFARGAGRHGAFGPKG